MGVAEGMWREIYQGRGPSPSRVEMLVDEEAPVFSAGERHELEKRLEADLLGAGPLEDLLRGEAVTDVLVNGPQSVWLDRGQGLEQVDVHLGDTEDVRRLAVRLAGLAGRRLDDASPYVDAVLPGEAGWGSGVRLHVVLPPLVEGSAHVSLRIPARRRPALGELVECASVDPLVARLLTGLIRREVAFVVSGGTGSGKTTLLGALLALVPHDQRVVVVEDVRELAIDHPHVVRLESRAPNVEGVGEIPLTVLVRQSLRMRPDRIVVGEVRGAEVRDLMAALNTGHQGGCGTVHANAPGDVPARFEALGALAGMSPQAVRTQLSSAIRVVVHLVRDAQGRRVQSIGLLRGSHGEVVIEDAWCDGVPGSGWDRAQELAGVVR